MTKYVVGFSSESSYPAHKPWQQQQHQCWLRCHGSQWMMGIVASYQDDPAWYLQLMTPLQLKCCFPHSQFTHLNACWVLKKCLEWNINIATQMPTVVARNVVERLRSGGGVSTTSCKKHVLMYPDGSWDDAAKAHTRENITVVGLPETSLNSSYMSDLRTWNQNRRWQITKSSCFEHKIPSQPFASFHFQFLHSWILSTMTNYKLPIECLSHL